MFNVAGFYQHALGDTQHQSIN